jgi:hypothetical protein
MSQEIQKTPAFHSIITQKVELIMNLVVIFTSISSVGLKERFRTATIFNTSSLSGRIDLMKILLFWFTDT